MAYFFLFQCHSWNINHVRICLTSFSFSNDSLSWICKLSYDVTTGHIGIRNIETAAMLKSVWKKSLGDWAVFWCKKIILHCLWSNEQKRSIDLYSYFFPFSHLTCAQTSLSRWRCAHKGRREGHNGQRSFACRLYPSHGPLRFITGHSRFALASTMRKTKRLRRRPISDHVMLPHLGSPWRHGLLPTCKLFLSLTLRPGNGN